MEILSWLVSLSSSVVPSLRLFVRVSWPLGKRVSSLAWVVVVPSWPSEVEEEVPSWPSEVVVVPSWPSEVEEVVPFCPLVAVVAVVVVVSSPWLTPHANTEPL